MYAIVTFDMQFGRDASDTIKGKLEELTIRHASCQRVCANVYVIPLDTHGAALFEMIDALDTSYIRDYKIAFLEGCPLFISRKIKSV